LQQQFQQHTQQQQDSEAQQQHPLTMPVSAVAAGWAPDRTGAAPTGSGALRIDCVGAPLASFPMLRSWLLTRLAL
jgi:hypothetical protein